MDLILAYGAGLLTLINPCVLPILPIVLATSFQAGRFGPVVLAAGMSVSFVALGMFVSSLGPALGISEETVAQVAALVLVAFGLTLLVPALSARFATATAGLSAHADQGAASLDASGTRGQFFTGILMGAVWSPCIGPTLGGAIALASTGESLGLAFAIMVFFALGVSTIILVLSYGARSAIQSRQASLRALAEKSKPVMGVVFVAVGLMLLFQLHHVVEAWALDALPHWLTDFSVSI
ncbi:MAG: cytochrome c biogenesis CcdA family protein [Brevirhabdus sp.]